MTTRLKYLILVLIALIVSFIGLRGCDKRINTSIASTVLPIGVVEKLIINPDTHQLTIVTPNRQETLFLPDRPSSIEIGDKGKVTVTSKQYGTELKPFVGLGYGEKFRFYGGLDLLYWKRLDAGLFISGGLNAPGRIGGNLSYTVLSNTRLAVGVDNSQHLNLMVSIRL